MKNEATRTAADAMKLAGRVSQLQAKRMRVAGERFAKRVGHARAIAGGAKPLTPIELGKLGVDAVQRWVLFWDTLRSRGNRFVEHEREGMPPVLHFDFETVIDGRQLPRPVNYALVRITPPEGVKVDDKRRPYVIIDPRAGHGPGIGGMKDDSQVGVALRGGHPVYFVIFFTKPEPGQTLLDVCEAERVFIEKVRRLHPKSPKPVVVGNCQGGWAAMMLAAANPADVGPIVINGAPMSYWGGAWSEGEGDNPMRYAGGNLGGTWLASLFSDLGDGVFDGAWLVENFEKLNPANTYWEKYYNLYANVDQEAPRFLDFERWWGGFYLMNREEIEWITQNLFVGNRLWKGGVKSGAGKVFDLKELRSPVILFASMGDNITPPQQAFNWVADVYGSTEEVKARGQVIVGLMHESVGHLGIFVSGKVAKKEYTQIAAVLEHIEALPPGLYAMKILEEKGRDGAVGYHVQFEERRLEDMAARLNRFSRNDEQPFEAAAAVSDFNQRAYELFARPFVKALANPVTAQASRQFHPLRWQRWAISDVNPFLWWLEPAATAVRQARAEVPRDAGSRAGERAASETISAWLDLWRDLRDAQSESQFFRTYGNLLHLAPGAEPDQHPAAQAIVARVRAGAGEGGYAEAVARSAHLLRRANEPLSLETLETKEELMAEYAAYLPKLDGASARRVRGEQAVLVEHDRALALATLPRLVARQADRQRLLALLERLCADPRVIAKLDRARQQTLAEIRAALGARVAKSKAKSRKAGTR